jgi:hypothetical protein
VSRVVFHAEAQAELIAAAADGVGIHWPDLDEDLSVEGILAGRPSAESQASLRKWLKARVRGRAADPPRR